MERHDIEELMALDWTVEVVPDDDGGIVLTVQNLPDFAVFGRSREDVLEQFDDALRSHLLGYLAIGKVVPVPASGQVVQGHQETAGEGHWDYLGFNAMTGQVKKKPTAI